MPTNSSDTPTLLPTAAPDRKAVPLTSGVLDYFPAALAEVARLSKIGNDQHNAGEPMHWARGKSNDHADCLARHLLERGTIDTDGVRHSAKLAWRALALLQLELEAEGAPIARGAKEDPVSVLERIAAAPDGAAVPVTNEEMKAVHRRGLGPQESAKQFAQKYREKHRPEYGD